MAKGYRTKHDVSFPVVVARTGEGENDYAAEGRNYPAGSLVYHDTLPPYLQKQAQEGKLDHVLDPIEDDEEFEHESNYVQAGEPEFGIFAAEHEAEAHALREAGHHVIPKQQLLESLSAGAPHAERYQNAVKEAGLDRRPNQEWMAQAESESGRIPDHFLQGAETRSGMPHNRGPAVQSEDDENADESEESDSPASRPRPGGQAETADSSSSGSGD